MSENFDDAAGEPIELTPYPDDLDITTENVDDLDGQDTGHACPE